MEHKPAKIAVIVATLLIFIATAILNAFANQPEYSSGIYTRTMGNISQDYMTGITPANWTFGIWGVIYFWMAVWIIYCNVAICIKWENDYFYKHEIFLPAYFFIIYIINLILNVVWLILFDKEYMIASFFILLALAVTAIVCLVVAIYTLAKGMERVDRIEFATYFWLYQILIINGIGCYATWLTIATHLNLNIALIYSWDIDASADTIILIVLLVVGASWFSLDLIMTERHTRFLITPYLVLTVSMAGIVSKHVNLDDFERLAIFMVVILAIFVMGCLCKIYAICRNHYRASRTRALI